MQKEKENPVTSVKYKLSILVLCDVTFSCLKDNINFFFNFDFKGFTYL